MSFKEFLKQNDPSLEEGWSEKVGAFGRSFADKASLGGYKYARAAVDHGIKKALGKSKTYQNELDQEKEKLEKDSKEQPAASAAGDIVGHAVPYVPVVGPLVQSAKNVLDKIIGVGEKAAPVADKIQRAVKQN